MITEDPKTNFMKITHKALQAMAKEKAFPKDIHILARYGVLKAKKGYDFFIQWFDALSPEDKEVIAGEIQHFTRQKKKTIEKMLGYTFESEVKEFKDIIEIAKKVNGVTFTFGRFNPPTVGHVKLAAKMKQKAGTDDIRMYTSHTTDKKKNPLTNAQIRKFMNPMLPRGIDVVTSSARTVFDVLTRLYDDGYKDVQMIVGSDRVTEFQNLLKKYNGKKSTHGYYNFESLKVVSAGERDPDAEGVEGMSASKMRQFAQAGEEKEFIKALPTGYRLGKQLYKAVKKGMGITEDFPDFMYEIYDPSVHQWGTEKGREYAQSVTPHEPVVKWVKKSVKETEELPKKVLLYKEKMYKELKSERAGFIKKYGERADEVMHATAMSMAKRKYGYS